MDGWTDGRTDAWTDGRRGGWMDGWMDGRTDGWMDGWAEGWMDEALNPKPEASSILPGGGNELPEVCTVGGAR